MYERLVTSTGSEGSSVPNEHHGGTEDSSLSGVALPAARTPSLSPETPTSLQHPLLGGAMDQDKKTPGSTVEYQVYVRRWIVLCLFVCYSASNAFQWIQYSIITNVIMEYYGVKALLVDMCSMIYMILYIPMIFPASYYLHRYGLRKSVLIGSFGTMVGSWIKCGSVDPSRFWVTFVGQVVVALSQVFILGIPPRLAAVWFNAERVSTACAVGVFGNQLGVALGFLLPPVIVPDDQGTEGIARGLNIMFYSLSSLCTVIFLLIVVFFKEQPPTPPSAATATALEEEHTSYTDVIKRLFKHKGYILLLLSYGMNVGVFYAISTLLNQVVLVYFPGQTEDAGRIGLLIVLAGMLGSVCSGFILDKTGRFKLVTLLIYCFTVIFMLVYTFIYKLKVLALVYLLSGCLGFFMTGYLPVGFEFAAELTYPEPEGTSSGLLNASAQVFGLICTIAGGQLLEHIGDIALNLLMCGVLFLGTIMTGCIKEDLKRQKANTVNISKYMEEMQTRNTNGLSHVV